jgi:hypothetical protein
MPKLLIAGIALAAVLSIPAPGWSHEGHAHKVMGTVSALQGNRVELKTPEGKTVTVVLSEKTKYARGRQRLDASAVKVGERIVAEVASEKDMIASTVTLAAAAPVTARK